MCIASIQQSAAWLAKSLHVARIGNNHGIASTFAKATADRSVVSTLPRNDTKLIRIGNDKYMTKNQKISLLVLRVSMGWIFFYAGITKVMNPEWSAKGYLLGAKTLTGLFGWLANSDILPIVNLLNEWGLTLIGVSLILGIWVRASAMLGSVLMLMYYIPVLEFPYAGSHAYIIDEHIIYAIILILFALFHDTRVWNIRSLLEKLIK